MAFTINTKTEVTDTELELRFLRHLAWRAYHEDGKYLSELDKKALQILNEAHCQDVSRTSVAELAVQEFQSMNPKWTVIYNIN